MIRKVCNVCGSKEIDFQGSIVWSCEYQKFEVEYVDLSSCWCANCNSLQPVRTEKISFQWEIIDKAGIKFLTEKHYGSLDEVKQDYCVEDIAEFRRVDSTRKVEVLKGEQEAFLHVTR